MYVYSASICSFTVLSHTESVIQEVYPKLSTAKEVDSLHWCGLQLSFTEEQSRHEADCGEENRQDCRR